MLDAEPRLVVVLILHVPSLLKYIHFTGGGHSNRNTAVQATASTVIVHLSQLVSYHLHEGGLTVELWCLS